VAPRSWHPPAVEAGGLSYSLFPRKFCTVMYYTHEWYSLSPDIAPRKSDCVCCSLNEQHTFLQYEAGSNPECVIFNLHSRQTSSTMFLWRFGTLRPVSWGRWKVLRDRINTRTSPVIWEQGWLADQWIPADPIPAQVGRWAPTRT